MKFNEYQEKEEGEELEGGLHTIRTSIWYKNFHFSVWGPY